MAQSSAIFAFLAIAFVVFITQRGELRVYMGFLLGNVSKTPSNVTIQTKGGFDLGDLAGTAAKFAPLVL